MFQITCVAIKPSMDQIWKPKGRHVWTWCETRFEWWWRFKPSSGLWHHAVM